MPHYPQIWFQNRRQNDRRKYKPSHQDNTATEVVPQPKVNQVQIQQEFEAAATSKSAMKNVRRASISGPVATPQGPPGSALLFVPVNPASTGPDRRCLTDSKNYLPSPMSAKPDQKPDAIPASQTKSTRKDITQTTMSPRTTSKTPPSLRISLSGDGEAVIRKGGERTPSHRKKRQRGPMRISLSADGEALVRMANEPSPLKNRDSNASSGECLSPLSGKRQFNGLRRCHSAVSMRSLNAKGPESASSSRMLGRSQDSRAWGLFCNDTDARSALSGVHNMPTASASRTPPILDQHVDKSLPNIEASPPLAAPTKPSTPQSSAIKEPNKRAHKLSSTGANPRSAKRTVLGAKTANACNVQSNTSAPANDNVGSESSVKRKKLSRVVSSAARLESTNHSALKPRPKHTATMDRLHSGDSDKENWIPGPPAARGWEALGRSDGYGDRSYVSSIAERSDPEMGSSFAFPQSSQDEDMDCIHGLLSLSQGAWN